MWGDRGRFATPAECTATVVVDGELVSLVFSLFSSRTYIHPVFALVNAHTTFFRKNIIIYYCLVMTDPTSDDSSPNPNNTNRTLNWNNKRLNFISHYLPLLKPFVDLSKSFSKTANSCGIWLFPIIFRNN